MHTSLLDDNRAVEPPESIPNSEVKRSIADGSVGLPHVRVGHRQALIQSPSSESYWGFSLSAISKNNPVSESQRTRYWDFE